MLALDTLKDLKKETATQAANDQVERAIVRAQPVALPSDFQLQSLEKFTRNRYRARGTMTTKNMDDFANYVKTEGDSSSRIFVDADTMKATAVLNFGTLAMPGHCDDLALLALDKTAACTRLVSVDGKPQSQLTTAEFFEDFAPLMKFYGKNAEGEQIEIPFAKAVAAVRKLSIEASKKLESEESQLSASRSTFDSTRVANDVFPSHVYFTTVPYHGLDERTFVLRVSVITTGPAVVLRTVNPEQHLEDMAQEFVETLQQTIGEKTILTGTYKPNP